MTIPWGDVSTAYASTGIANIEVFIPGSPAMIANARRANYIRWLLGLAPVQRLMKNRIARTVKGPSASQREKLRSEEHTSELQSLMRISYAVFCLKKKTNKQINNTTTNHQYTHKT